MNKRAATTESGGRERRDIQDVLAATAEVPDLNVFQLSQEILRFQNGGDDIVKKQLLSERLPFLEAALSRVNNWLDKWDARRDFVGFKELWKYVRRGMDLQTMLIIEQVFWDRGYPYRSLLSGFKPIE